ncbi:hypothetical protein B0T20DRAFT_341491, partial [Sordaria brevicollis]
AGATALHYAAFHGDEDMVKFLLGQGADTRVQDQFGLTPQAIAAVQGHEFRAQLLAEE